MLADLPLVLDIVKTLHHGLTIPIACKIRIRPNDPTYADTIAYARALEAAVAVGETVILLHPPPPLVGVSVAMERERQQNDSLADG